MTHPKDNDTVVLVITGKLDNGEIFYVVEEDDPMRIKVGNSDLPPTVENGLLSMTVGETRKIRVPPEEGYGHRHKDLLQVIENQEMVDSVKPAPGMVLSLKVLKDGEEQKVPATVMSVEGSKITVDYNHPLAGHHLTFEIKLLDIEDGGVH